ncbi:exodeoxyribonuclease V subunit beta [Actinobacillus seminis]|uniref:RecBCD enzyme subunit RecB n=1 Tax=Actinobacillus seminis TaxID=722 RepID=A0A263HD98_9PAST|nr:exodeoxyribonuclease V subunit beta [Actinobacillus seminis]OZN24918.1 exodeoxyribonuclease V subunit beta [Actinobacillus seminis]SUU36527.1 exodeoxyribonuclease V subunit beta [Actinobacillus seminis]
MTTQSLNPISMPLHSVSLIEASAGTGKTHTMVSLYLRLLLQAGENSFPQALNVEQILVVTFTEMATQELKERIRERIYQSKQLLIQYRQTQDKTVLAKDPFLFELADSITDLTQAISRLTLAEQNMDLAKISTIHSFCLQTLMQYAFNSGIHFNIELLSDEQELLQRIVNEFWRTHFYHQSVAATRYIFSQCRTPAQLLDKIASQLSGVELKPQINAPHLLDGDISSFLSAISPLLFALNEFKQTWLNVAPDLHAQMKEKKTVRADWLSSRFAELHLWASDPNKISVAEKLQYFTTEAINKSKNPVEHPIFAEVDQLIAEIGTQIDTLEAVFLYHCINAIRQRWFEYKLNHHQKGFNDLLRLVHDALHGEQGERLAELIRQQFPFAMIDEFQDTDALQYQIFATVYLSPQAKDCGFIMIGDPKQSIYKFRGADIFTYLKAAKQAQQRYTLTENWRSGQLLIDCVNRFFDFQQPPPFLYQDIQFLPVRAGSEKADFVLNGKIEPPMRCYVGEAKNFADCCANSIQHWLKSAMENQAKIAEDPLQAKNIAVLVRSATQAEMIKQALLARGIASVYLSDKSNVVDSPVAMELLQILYACFNPLSERTLLRAISCSLFALSCEQLYRIRQNENQWEMWVETFLAYRKLWQQQGVLVMLHYLLQEQQISEKLLAQPQGERKLTDFLHLAELLQQAARLNETEAALLHWFEKQIQGKARLTENIRLESERELVKIVTIHKSKGLAYDVVWLPFIANAWINYSDPIETYYDSDADEVFWDMNGAHADERLQEKMAEELRLLYVALTRAKYQVVMALPEQFKDSWSALLYCLTQGKIGDQPKIKAKFDKSVVNLIENLKSLSANLAIEIQPIDTLEILPPLSDVVPEEPLSSASFHGYIQRDWQVSSFSKLLERHQRLLAEQNAERSGESAVEISPISDAAKDYDRQFTTEEMPKEIISPISEEAEITPYPSGFSPLDFPHGSHIGTVLHRYFEKYDFAQFTDADKLRDFCHGLMLSEDWVVPLQQWFNAILHTPLIANESLNLGQISRKNALRELQFYLQVNQKFSAKKFNLLLEKYHHLKSNPLISYEFNGMLRGFIDLVFRHQGKYYIVDYKSNFLGSLAADYAPSALTQVMLNSHYDWQYLLYCVALHRYLKSRDPDYQYERHFGGVIYAFLRGMNGQPAPSGKSGQGIFFDKPDLRLIEGLEELF